MKPGTGNYSTPNLMRDSMEAAHKAIARAKGVA